MGDAFTRFYLPYTFISVWAKLYRRSVMGDGLLETEKDFGVWIYNLDVFPRCRGLKLVPEIVYYYRFVPTSVSRHFRSRILYTCASIYERTCDTFSAYPKVRAYMARKYGYRVAMFSCGVVELSNVSKFQKLAMIEAEMLQPIYQQEPIRSVELDQDKNGIWKAFLAQDAETVYREAERLIQEGDDACFPSGWQI